MLSWDESMGKFRLNKHTPLLCETVTKSNNYCPKPCVSVAAVVCARYTIQCSKDCCWYCCLSNHMFLPSYPVSNPFPSKPKPRSHQKH